MQAFVELFRAIDASTSTSRKIEAAADYFRRTDPKDALWALYLLSGRKQKRLLARKDLQEAIQAKCGISSWLFDESYAVVGDLAETIALLLPDSVADQASWPLHIWMEEKLPLLRQHPEPQNLLLTWWEAHNREQNFILNKLITGGFRVGFAKASLIKALALAYEQPIAFLTESLSGDWPLDAAWLTELQAGNRSETAPESRGPFPFYLASSFDQQAADRPLSDFAIEWKWDGIRAQLIKRGSHLALWSRGEEWLNDKFPDIVSAATAIAGDCVLDGELLLARDGNILPFADLQKRIGRTKLSAKFLEAHPALFLAFDCLELAGEDLRPRSQGQRREALDHLLRDAPPQFRVSPLLSAASWEEAAALRAEALSLKAEGLMLKSWDGPYKMGRRRGDWWKWKLDPMSLDAVLIYAQAGHGRRANLYTDYTFALWNEGQLVPFAKAYSGLTDQAILELDRWIRSHTLERFGPVRSVQAERVFEIAFEGIGLSARHKSGIAVRFPRILRERTDKKAAEADTLERAKELIHARL